VTKNDAKHGRAFAEAGAGGGDGDGADDDEVDGQDGVQGIGRDRS